MSIFVEGSIFTLSGNIFPLDHELGRSARWLLAASGVTGSAELGPGWTAGSHRDRRAPQDDLGT